MKSLNTQDYKFFTNILQLTQKEMIRFLPKVLGRYGYKNITVNPAYITAEGDIPIALAAHMDTVFDEKTRNDLNVLYDRQKNIMIAPDGLGADDRAGIFSIIKILQKGLKPHVIFCTDEEIGCIGSSKLAEEKCPFKDLRYIIQLDRRGANDCVFYECDNEKFEEYVEKFGFVTEWGSYTDICELCPAWGMAGVNLSVGYLNEHCTYETLHVGHMLDTVDKVANMLKEKEIPYFQYIPCSYSYYSKYGKYGYDDSWKYFDDDEVYYNPDHLENVSYICHGCGRKFSSDDVLPVKLLHGGIGYFCEDCLDRDVNWCVNCGEPFEVDPDHPSDVICKDCLKEILEENNK